ncbi:MAG: hypothetical protein RLZZ387_344 [Chloroflexota bacterium]|jgi:hypothetical protein
MAVLVPLAVVAGLGAVLYSWYRRETMSEGDALVYLQSEHEHFHLHVDLPAGMEIEPGDTIELLTVPQTHGHTPGEVSYPSRVRLTKASWLRRTLVKRSSLVELNELVEHP